MADEGEIRAIFSLSPPSNKHSALVILAHSVLAHHGLEFSKGKLSQAGIFKLETSVLLNVAQQQSLEVSLGDVVQDSPSFNDPDKVYKLGMFSFSQKLAEILSTMLHHSSSSSVPGAKVNPPAPPSARADAMPTPPSGRLSSHEGLRNPLSIGEDDLIPGGGGGRGMLVGPNDPIFNARFGYPPHHQSSPFGFVPPGARFDPIMPGGHPGIGIPRPGGGFGGRRFGPTGEPDADHLPPPGYPDVFM